MALSEHEQRLLDEMERNLYQHDADFVAPSGAHGRVSYVALTIGVLVAVIGLGIVIAGVAFQAPVIGLVGFVVMLVGVLVAMRRTADPSEAEGGAPASKDPRTKSSFMSNLEERWERRRDGER